MWKKNLTKINHISFSVHDEWRRILTNEFESYLKLRLYALQDDRLEIFSTYPVCIVAQWLKYLDPNSAPIEWNISYCHCYQFAPMALAHPIASSSSLFQAIVINFILKIKNHNEKLMMNFPNFSSTKSILIWKRVFELHPLPSHRFRLIAFIKVGVNMPAGLYTFIVPCRNFHAFDARAISNDEFLTTNSDILQIFQTNFVN